MANIYCNNFTYNNKSIKDFVENMVTISFSNSSSDDVEIITKKWDNSDYTPDRHVSNQYGVVYDDSLVFDIQISKEDATPFTTDEKRKIASWLTSVDCAKPLTIDSEEHRSIVYYGLFKKISKHTISEIPYGMTFSFECNAPYGYEIENNSYSLTATSNEKTVVINNTSDELNENLYPSIYITPRATGTVSIANNTTGLLSAIDVLANMPVYINNNMKIINDDNGMYDISKFNCNWFYLVSGENSITINGDCDIIIKCQYPRKAGV